MYCNACGKKLRINDSVCPECGTPVLSQEHLLGFWDLVNEIPEKPEEKPIMPVIDENKEPVKVIPEMINEPVMKPAKKPMSRRILYPVIFAVTASLLFLGFFGWDMNNKNNDLKKQNADKQEAIAKLEEDNQKLQDDNARQEKRINELESQDNENSGNSGIQEYAEIIIENLQNLFSQGDNVQTESDEAELYRGNER